VGAGGVNTFFQKSVPRYLLILLLYYRYIFSRNSRVYGLLRLFARAGLFARACHGRLGCG
jgi:hypothetical protein